MIAAEEWRKYEENYIRYGLDLQPDINEKREAKKNKISFRTSLLNIAEALSLGKCFLIHYEKHLLLYQVLCERGG